MQNIVAEFSNFENCIVVTNLVHVIVYVATAVNYVVPSKVTSVPVLPVLTTKTGIGLL